MSVVPHANIRCRRSGKYGEVEFAFPAAKSEREAGSHGLWLVYVDSFEGDPHPFIELLGPDTKTNK